MIEKTGNDLVVIASNAKELAEGQHATVAVMKEKESEALLELNGARELLAQAKKSKFSPKAAQALIRKCEARVLYLGKIREALEAGFVIVPNFPARTIAIRVDRRNPKKVLTEAQRYIPHVPDESAERLPAGDGRYVKPEPVQSSLETSEYEGDKHIVKYKSFPAAFNDNLDLPVEFMIPTVVERTSAAMARKIFDEVAITQDFDWPHRNDPMVIGRILGASRKFTSFLIAWFVDTKGI